MNKICVKNTVVLLHEFFLKVHPLKGEIKYNPLRVVGHGYSAALKECADLGFVVN